MSLVRVAEYKIRRQIRDPSTYKYMYDGPQQSWSMCKESIKSLSSMIFSEVEIHLVTFVLSSSATQAVPHLKKDLHARNLPVVMETPTLSRRCLVGIFRLKFPYIAYSDSGLYIIFVTHSNDAIITIPRARHDLIWWVP